jgi:hypothetical protein
VLSGELKTLSPNQVNELEFDCPAGRDTMPFYRHKDTVYNTWFMSVSITYLWAKLLLEGSQAACIERLTSSLH